MLYTITVKDQATGSPLPGATVAYTGADGKPTASQTTGADGTVSFDDTVHPEFLFSGALVQASAPGYSPLSIGGENLEQSWYFALVKNKSNLLPILVGVGLGLGAMYLLSREHKKVGAAEGAASEKTDYAEYVIPVGLVGIGYFVVKSITNTLGLTETADQRAQREASQNALTTTANAEYANHPPTQSDAVWSAAADEIYGDLSSPMPLFNTNKPDDVAAILAEPQNTSDLLKIIQYFGSRTQTLFGIPGPSMTLAQFVRTASHSLSADQIAALNADYATRGINWQW